jgi:hypothetical protein
VNSPHSSFMLLVMPGLCILGCSGSQEKKPVVTRLDRPVILDLGLPFVLDRGHVYLDPPLFP